jgi:hypothetical protein
MPLHSERTATARRLERGLLEIAAANFFMRKTGAASVLSSKRPLA